MKLPIEKQSSSLFNQLVELGVSVRMAKAVSEMLSLSGAKTASRVVVGKSVRESRSMLCGDMSAMLKVAAPTPGGGGGSSSSSGGSSSSSSGGGYGGGCFAEGTLILMGDGSTSPIEDIQEGDQVSAYDFASDEVVSASVVGLFPQQFRDDWKTLGFEEFVSLTSTECHPYWTQEEGWASLNPEKTRDLYDLEVALLEDGMSCLMNSGEWVVLSSVEEAAPQDTYNIQVEDHHNYFASGILVHNKRGMGMSDEDSDEDEDDLQLATDTVKLGYALARNMGVPQDKAMMMAMYAHTRLLER